MFFWETVKKEKEKSKENAGIPHENKWTKNKILPPAATTSKLYTSRLYRWQVGN